MERVDELRQLLEKYDEQYYNQQKALITDAEYDALKDEYLYLGGKDFVSGEIKKGKKVKHTFYASSLNKVKENEKEKLKKLITELFPVVIEYKFDGLTEVDYGDKFVSRGNGEYGEDKTSRRKYIKGIGNYFGHPVRGEVMMLKSDFNKINEKLIKEGKDKLSNCRNGASGMMTRENIPSEGLTYFAYYVDGISNPLEQMRLLKEHGYNCLEGYIPTSIDDAINYLETFDRNSLDFDIDGLVVKSLRDKDFGSTEHHPKNAFAYKWNNESKFTRLISIDWQVGKTGIVSPVANFEPVELNGAIVERATLHNMDYINGLGLDKIYKYGGETLVEVIRSNEVIPRILSVKHECGDSVSCIAIPVSNPEFCPECGSKLENVNGLLYCRNPHCKEQTIAKAINMCSRDALDIRGLSEETIRKMYEYIKYQYELNESEIDFTFPLEFDYNMLMNIEGFAEKSARTLSEEIKLKTKNIEFRRFLNASNIPLLGKSASKEIEKVFKSVHELTNDISLGGKKLMSIDGLGQELYNSINTNGYNIDRLLNFVTIKYEEKEVSDKLNGVTFVITGDVHIFKNRKELQDMIESLGGKVSGSVSAKTSYLINNDKDSTSSKNKKAQQLNIPILSEEDFMKLIK